MRLTKFEQMKGKTIAEVTTETGTEDETRTIRLLFTDGTDIVVGCDRYEDESPFLDIVPEYIPKPPKSYIEQQWANYQQNITHPSIYEKMVRRELDHPLSGGRNARILNIKLTGVIE